VNAPELAVDSATGVDVQLPVAAAGGRSYAFIVDWHIRFILAIAWYVLGTLIFNQRWSLAAPPDPGTAWFVTVLAPTFALYFLYHPILEIAMSGRTPGKRIAGVRIVNRSGGPPTVGALLMRNVFRLIDGFPGVYCIGLVATLVTPNHVRIGDLAAGTLLVYERADLLVHEPVFAPPSPASDAAPALPVGSYADAGSEDPRIAELAAELLGRWDFLEESARAELARALLERARQPWPGSSAPSTASERAVLRAAVARLAGAVA
jgi:uncharacterized RDD family membrane protein YckC